jgi:methylase of polypeptide subunit release factors
MATVEELLRPAIDRLRAAGSETARLDAELLLAHAIGTDRTAVVAHPDARVGDGPAERFEAALVRRETGEPVAYIRGFKEFYGYAFATDSRALIPRPETERLVELAEAEVMRRLTSSPRPASAPPLRIADVGLFEAIRVAEFADTSRDPDGGHGLDGVVEIDDGYFNPFPELWGRVQP